MSVRIFLPDQSEKIFAQPPTGLEVAQSIGPRLAQDTLGVKVNGNPEIQDLRFPLPDGARIELVTTKSDHALEVIRHSAAHIMAQAVQALWPEVKVTIGPVIEDGFFYDFDCEKKFSEADFEVIEKKIKELISANFPITRQEMPARQAIEIFQKLGERFKVEIIQDLAAKDSKGLDMPVGLYHQGDWFDLCRGPHVQRTGQIGVVKLMSVAGAYWRGDESKPMLQRIYATAFRNQQELSEHLVRLEEAKKRDHRKLGKEMGLFHFHEWAPGSPFFTGKGAVVYNELQKYLREKYAFFGYQEVISPQIFDVELFKTSGHYKNYIENMFFTRADEKDYGVKPMNCPGHCLLYGSDWHSYRDLPLRVADFGRLHRFEKSGAMHGLTRVRTFCQDDAHIFCTHEQLQSEIEGFMQFLSTVYNDLGMQNYRVLLSTRPEKKLGDDALWDRSEGVLKAALESQKIPYTINAGDGAFYGPKLDVMFVDAIRRPWQLGTLQLDYNLPELFSLKYSGVDNQEHRPVMLHRAILGSLERFIGVYLEHCAGHLPLWLAPVQVKLLSVTDRVNPYAERLLQDLKSKGVRVEWDRRSEKLSYKIREAQMEKTPFMWILGDQEMQNEQVSVRFHTGKTENAVPMEKAVAWTLDQIQKRTLKQEQIMNGAHT